MYAKFILLFLGIIFMTCDPTKSSSIRIKRQWNWNDVTIATSSSSPPTSSPTQAQTTAANADTLRECLNRCQTTNEYNPVCGTNGITYDNPHKLGCAARCGASVRISFMGSCKPL